LIFRENVESAKARSTFSFLLMERRFASKREATPGFCAFVWGVASLFAENSVVFLRKNEKKSKRLLLIAREFG